MEQLTGIVTNGLDDSLVVLWITRAPWDHRPDTYTWEEMISSVQDTARKAAALDGLTPAQVIERQIEAVKSGAVDGRTANAEYNYDVRIAPFCGCLIGWAGYAVGHKPIDPQAIDEPLFRTIRDGLPYAPVEILAYLLLPGEQSEPQSALVIRALEQAKAGL